MVSQSVQDRRCSGHVAAAVSSTLHNSRPDRGERSLYSLRLTPAPSLLSLHLQPLTPTPTAQWRGLSLLISSSTWQWQS
jgi:hypothetical protein